jgi:hypothetical protein
MTRDLGAPPSPQADILSQLMDEAEESGLFAAVGTVTDGITATVTIGDDLAGKFVITCTPEAAK